MLWNNHWTERTFIYDKQKQYLKISGDNFNELGIHDKFGRIQILTTIPIKHLDISNSEVSDLSYLYDIQLTTLDIRRTFVQDLSPIKNLKSLKTLIVNPKQFTQEKLSEIPSHVKIIYKN